MKETHTPPHRTVHSKNVHLIAPFEDGNVQLIFLQARHTVNERHRASVAGNARAVQVHYVIHVLKPLAVLTFGERVNCTCSCQPHCSPHTVQRLLAFNSASMQHALAAPRYSTLGTLSMDGPSGKTHVNHLALVRLGPSGRLRTPPGQEKGRELLRPRQLVRPRREASPRLASPRLASLQAWSRPQT